MVKLSSIIVFALILLVASLLLFAVSQRIYGEMTGKWANPGGQPVSEQNSRSIQTYTLW